MLTNLYLIRHAHSEYTPDEIGRPLSKKGHLDAKRITELLKDEKLDHFFSSPYKRAIQTVEGAANLHGKPIDIEEGFKERKLASVPVEDFPLAMQKVWGDPDFSFPGGESNNLAQKRGISATLRLLEEYQGKNIAIGTHGNIMVLIMNYFDRAYGMEFWESLAMPDIYKLSFEGTKFMCAQKVF